MNDEQKRTNEVTKNLISICKNKRMQVFHNMAKMNAIKRSKEFFRIYSSPSDSTLNMKRAGKYRSKFHPPKQKPFSYQMEYEKLRGLRESEEELAKVQAYIDKMIQKNIKKFEDEKRRRQLAEKSAENQRLTLQALVRSLH